MSTIAFITDNHWNVHNSSDVHEQHIVDFFQNQFFPYVLENKIKHIFNLGDMFDNRKFVNVKTMSTFKKHFVSFFEQNPDVTLYSLCGNHDVFYKNTNEVNSIEHLLDFKNSKIFVNPEIIHIDEHELFMIPWLCSENFNEFTKLSTQTNAKYAFGHLELSGFEFSKGIVCEEGYDPNVFKKFDKVLTGHFHYKSSKKNVHYLGSQYHLNWGDIDDLRGFHTLDLTNGSLTFIPNENKLYNSLKYNDDKPISKKELEKYAGKFLRIIVEKKFDKKKFDLFCDKLGEINFAECQIIDLPDEVVESDEEFNPENQDTITFLKKYVDSIDDIDVNKSKLKTFMTTLYSESLYV